MGNATSLVLPYHWYQGPHRKDSANVVPQLQFCSAADNPPIFSATNQRGSFRFHPFQPDKIFDARTLYCMYLIQIITIHELEMDDQISLAVFKGSAELKETTFAQEKSFIPSLEFREKWLQFYRDMCERRQKIKQRAAWSQRLGAKINMNGKRLRDDDYDDYDTESESKRHCSSGWQEPPQAVVPLPGHYITRLGREIPIHTPNLLNPMVLDPEPRSKECKTEIWQSKCRSISIIDERRCKKEKGRLVFLTRMRAFKQSMKHSPLKNEVQRAPFQFTFVADGSGSVGQSLEDLLRSPEFVGMDEIHALLEERHRRISGVPTNPWTRLWTLHKTIRRVAGLSV